MNKQAYFNLMQGKHCGMIKTAGKWQTFMRVLRNTSRVGKYLGGTAVGGAMLLPFISPEASAWVTRRLLYGPKQWVRETIPQAVHAVGDTFMEEHDVIDKNTGEPVKKPAVAQSIGQGIKKYLSPGIVEPFEKATQKIVELGKQVGKIGQEFGESAGTGFKNTGGKVLTGAGGAALGYTAADFIQDWFGPQKETPKQQRRRRIINILSAILAGGVGAHYSNNIYKFLD